MSFEPRRNYKSETAEKNERSSFIKTLVIVIAIALLIRIFIIETVRIDGPSMEPTLYSEERIMLDKVSYIFSKPSRFDIIVCKFDNDDGTYVKRIIALEGETVEITDGEVYINGEKLDDSAYANGISPTDYEPVTVPEGYVYVLGDNRDDSVDSRVKGCVQIKNIRGRGLVIIWPLDKITIF